MSRNLEAVVRCDVCGRTSLLWNCMRLVPHDDTQPDFLACVFCVRSFNTIAGLTQTTVQLHAECEWVHEGHTDAMPSSSPYHRTTLSRDV